MHTRHVTIGGPDTGNMRPTMAILDGVARRHDKARREAEMPASADCVSRLVVPSWVYKKPKYHGAATRITPLSGRFRDADWVEPRESLMNDPDGQKTYAVSANGGIRILNSTPLRVFETEGYVRWTFNPTKRPLVKRFFNIFKPFPYWTPFIFRHNVKADTSP